MITADKRVCVTFCRTCVSAAVCSIARPGNSHSAVRVQRANILSCVMRARELHLRVAAPLALKRSTMKYFRSRAPPPRLFELRVPVLYGLFRLFRVSLRPSPLQIDKFTPCLSPGGNHKAFMCCVTRRNARPSASQQSPRMLARLRRALETLIFAHMGCNRAGSGDSAALHMRSGADA